MSKTIKEFSEVVNLSIKMLEAPKNVLEFEKYDVASSNIDCVIALLKNLQPPRPTCATCDDCEHHEIDCGEGVLSDCYRCLSDKLDWNMLPYIEEPTNFGCIHHSDYEVAE